MKVSDIGLSLIKRFEGLKLSPYKCPAGYWTIGYGHLLKHTDPHIWHVDEKEAGDLLRKDVRIAESAVGRLVRVALNQNQFDALVSFTFNLGSGALQRSTLRQKLNRGEYSDAANEFDKWTLAGGRRLLGLVRRRAAERLMFIAVFKN